MYMPSPSAGGSFQTTPSGTHLATCYRVIDLGTQAGQWQGKPKHDHLIMISWELADEMMEDGRPFTINRRYTFSSHEKSTFRQHLEAWRGKPFTDADFAGPPNGFHIRRIIGVPCIITVMHETKGEKTYDNVQTVSKIMKGQVAPPLVNSTVYLSLDPAEFNRDTFNSLSDSLRATIEKSPQYQELVRPRGEPAPVGGALAVDLNDDIPFAPSMI